MIRPIKIILFALLTIGMTNYSTTLAQRVDKENIEDFLITSSVRIALTTDPVIGAFDFKVKTSNKVVELEGFVDTSEQSSRAGQIASNVEGVKAVKNNIRVQQQKDTEDKINDVIITEKVKLALTADSEVNSLDIKVETANGEVILTGCADTKEHIKKAGKIAAGIKGVKSVKNNIGIKK